MFKTSFNVLAKYLGNSNQQYPSIEKFNKHIDDFKKALKPHTKMICLNSPNNPTGTTFKEDMIIQICEFAKEHDLYILCDEIYRGLDHKTQQLMPSFADYYDKAIVTQSLSKVYSFAGLRLGWIIANEDVIKDIETSRRDTNTINEQTQECDNARQNVVGIIENLSAISEENAAATEETTASMEELNATIGLVANSATKLKNLAVSLEEDTKFFKL